MAVGKGSLQRAANAAGKGQESDETKLKKAKKDTVKASKTEKRVQMKEDDAAVKTKTAEETSSKKVTKKQTKAARSAGIQMTYLLTVPADALQDIPDTWRGPKYVRPNVSALAESISKHGVLEPVPAVQTGENAYQIVGGSKRMQVVRMLGVAQVPVLVLPGASIEDAWKLYQELNVSAETGMVQRDWSAANDSAAGEEKQTAGQMQQKNAQTSRSLFGKQRIPEYLL